MGAGTLARFHAPSIRQDARAFTRNMSPRTQRPSIVGTLLARVLHAYQRAFTRNMSPRTQRPSIVGTLLARVLHACVLPVPSHTPRADVRPACLPASCDITHPTRLPASCMLACVLRDMPLHVWGCSSAGASCAICHPTGLTACIPARLHTRHDSSGYAYERFSRAYLTTRASSQRSRKSPLMSPPAPSREGRHRECGNRGRRYRL